MNAEATQLIDKIQNISDELSKYNKFLSEERIATFQTNYKKLKNSLEEILKTKRNLQIGIIGEVKAGKSSFINALIFDGKDILPKAPTPMTAALTKISYSDKFEAEIVFYDENDWNIIQYNADLADQLLRDLYNQEMHKSPYHINFEQFCTFKKDEVPKEYAGCKELIEMVEKNNLNILQYIGKIIEFSVENQDEYIEKLNDYVGADGKFTPIVKYSVIKLKNEQLRNIEIVDTPGMNDPIVSRTIVTSDFLMNCDVVFFLSYAGQFLSQEEMSLLTRSLPENSINHAYLIASKFDSAVLDYKQSKAPFKVAVQHTLANLNKQANVIISEYTAQHHVPAVIKAIQANLPPHPTSGLMYGSAMKIHNNERLTDAEEHILKQFEKRFEGFSRSPKELMKLANVHTIEGKILSKVKNDKDEIINKRATSIIHEQRSQFLNLIVQMEEQTIDNIQEMKHSDVLSLKNKVEKITSKLQSIRKNVKDIFTASYLKASHILVDIKVDVEKEISNHTGVKVTTSTTSDTGTRKTGFLGLKRESYTITTTNYTAEVTEVVASIRKYITRSREMINNEFKRLFDLQDMKKDIANEVVGAFDLVSDEFNESEIKRALEIALNRLIIQDIEIDQSKYDAKLMTIFSSPSVRNEDISKLQLEQERILQQVSNDIKREIDNKIKDIEWLLEKYAANFIDDIEEQIVVNAKKIEILLNDKEVNLKQMEEIALKLKAFKKQLTQ